MLAHRRALWGVLVAVPLAVAWSAPAVAQDGVLYEVSETMKLRQGKITRRMATATLVGSIKAGTPWCPYALAVWRCDITAIGSDSVDLGTGRGPVEADFAIVVQGDNPVDGPEWVVLRGTLKGSIDLSPAVLGYDGMLATGDELPIGTMTGTWSIRGESGGPLAGQTVRGKLAGVFRLPFTYGGSPAMYVDDQGGMAMVGPAEYSLNVPTVRLEITFTP